MAYMFGQVLEQVARREYAFTLLKFAVRTGKRESLSSHFSKDSTKKRIKNIAREKKCSTISSIYWKGIVVLAMIFLIPKFGVDRNIEISSISSYNNTQEDEEVTELNGRISLSPTIVSYYHTP